MADEEKEFTMTDEELKEKMVSAFKPMTEEEQKLFHFMLVECFFECAGFVAKAEKDDDFRVAKVQYDTYSFLLNMFEEPAEELRKIGYDNRHVLKTHIQKKFDEYVKKTFGKA